MQLEEHASAVLRNPSVFGAMKWNNDDSGRSRSLASTARREYYSQGTSRT